MAIFKSGNPTLTEKMFDKSYEMAAGNMGTMTVRGSINKFGFMMLMLIAGAAYNWNLYEQLKQDTMTTLMWVGIIGGLISALAITFKPNWAPFLAPLYALLEGLFIGAISAIMNAAFAESYPGLIMQAVGLTFGVALAMFLLYNFRVINATERFKSIVFTATLGIGIFYLITMVLRLFGVNVSFMYDSSLLSIGISLFVVAIAALNLIMDFDMIEQGAERGAPKFMEWYGAFGLMVTIVWLYIEMLKLLSKLSSRD
ncbi:Bax inhibitor-1/YccA family protein [Sediminibacterium sp. TEGAF015]|uniref:Bax inhibitor-1/YccA family protein n=1 Tax=Sediminibacterium sp. TEGAF015 TaxID=575378 RepID=UPI00220D197E|nr:Bax inhibitor-1/YccA family protein [Sediminibacterium sp. TEGAF015]BDQ12355.1 membrane protein [Sediminibacterium sp. TEGAF015]